MGSLSFVIRTAIMTSLAVVVMQIRWGEATIESHTMNFLTTSSLTRQVDGTAHGAVVFLRNSWSKALQLFDTNFSRSLQSDQIPGQRESRLQLRRSQEYVKTESDDLRARARAGVESARKSIRKFIDETEVPGEEKPSVTEETSQQ